MHSKLSADVMQLRLLGLQKPLLLKDLLAQVPKRHTVIRVVLIFFFHFCSWVFLTALWTLLVNYCVWSFHLTFLHLTRWNCSFAIHPFTLHFVNFFLHHYFVCRLLFVEGYKSKTSCFPCVFITHDNSITYFSIAREVLSKLVNRDVLRKSTNKDLASPRFISLFF